MPNEEKGEKGKLHAHIGKPHVYTHTHTYPMLRFNGLWNVRLLIHYPVLVVDEDNDMARDAAAAADDGKGTGDVLDW